MHSNVSFTGMALNETRLSAAARQGHGSVNLRFSAKGRAAPYGVRLPKDITNQSCFMKTETGSKISWSKKKVILQNPVNFTDWITNIENFLLQSVKQGIAQPHGLHSSAKPSSRLKQSRRSDTSLPVTEVVDLTGDDDAAISVKQENIEIASPVSPSFEPKTPVDSPTPQYTTPSSGIASPVRSIASPIVTSPVASIAAPFQPVLAAAAPSVVAHPGGSYKHQSLPYSRPLVSRPSALGSACESNTPVTCVAGHTVCSHTSAAHSDQPWSIADTGVKQTATRPDLPLPIEGVTCASEGPSSTASTTQPLSVPTARKRTGFHKPSVPSKKTDLLSTDVDTRQLVLHPAPLPLPPTGQVAGPEMKELPPKPRLKISRIHKGIVLSWNMAVTRQTEEITSYQLFAYQEGSAPATPSVWKKVGEVKALALPMACTLAQYQEGHNYHFAVRAMDKYQRVGPFSEPSSIHLNK